MTERVPVPAERSAAPWRTERIAVSAISFHRSLLSGRMEQSQVPGAASALGFTSVELLDMFAVPLPFGRWTGLARRGWYVLKTLVPFVPRRPRPVRPRHYGLAMAEALRAAADQSGVRVAAWALDTDLSVKGAALAEAGAYWLRGIETDRRLGASVLRVTSGGHPDPALLPGMRSNLRRLVDRAAGLRVAVENQGGMSDDPLMLSRLLEGVAGCCLDLGNFPHGIRAEAIRLLSPLTVHVHAKSYGFDARGDETIVDYPAFVSLLEGAGFDGVYSIEYEGYGNPAVGIGQTASLLSRLIEPALIARS